MDAPHVVTFRPETFSVPTLFEPFVYFDDVDFNRV